MSSAPRSHFTSWFRFSGPATLLLLVCVSGAGLALRGAPQPPASPSRLLAEQASEDARISPLLQTSLDSLQQSLTGLKMEKWKGGSVRTEAATNVASIQKDLQGTLPSLISAADAAPNSLSKALPVSRNLDALYDVLLRVVDGARVAAPGDQADQLMQAAAAVEKGRQALNDHLQQMADGAEKQVVELRAAVVKAQSPAPAPAPPVCPATPAPAAKKKVVKKKPATPPAATTPPAAAKPNPQ